MESHQEEADKLFRMGDKAAFESLFRSFYPRLVQYGQKILGDRDEAEELVQQVFVALWEARSKMDIHTSMKSYLFRAVHNRCLNAIEKEKVRRLHRDEVLAVSTEAMAPLQDMHYQELQRQMAKAVQQLPEQCRRIFELSRYEGLKYAAIAEVLGLSVKTVENQMGKALRILRSELKDYLVALVLLILTNYPD